MFNFLKWRKKSNNPQQIVSRHNFVSDEPREALVDFLLNKGENKLAARLLNRYYLTCAPLATAIDLIVQTSTNIDPKVFDRKEHKFLEKPHEILDLLFSPNATQSYTQFMDRLLGLFLLHGEVFIISSGDLTKKPKEIWAMSRQNVSLLEDTDGYIKTIKVQTGGRVETYFRREVDGKFRYYNREEKNNTPSLRDKEILQIKNFNPEGGLCPLHGRSQLHSIYFEIEQWIYAAQHNLSLLVRGARPTGVFTPSDELNGFTEEQHADLDQQIRNYWEGAKNAGRVGLLSQGVKFMGLSQSNIDLDFVAAKEQLQKDIYNRLKIPLPLVSEKTMTLANMNTSSLLLYDNAVKPLLNCIFNEITRLLMYRYKESENNILAIDEGDISVLAPRRIELAIQLQKTGASSINDRRALLNLDSMSQGANVVYGSVTDTPIAGDNIDDLEANAPSSTPSTSSAPDAPATVDEAPADEPTTQE